MLLLFWELHFKTTGLEQPHVFEFWGKGSYASFVGIFSQLPQCVEVSFNKQVSVLVVRGDFEESTQKCLHL